MATARNISSAISLAVASQTTGVWTYTFRASNLANLGVWIKCTGDTPAVRIVLEESYLDLTEAQQTLTNTSYVVPDAFPDVFSDINDTNPHITSITPVPMKHLRYKLIGLSGNSANTTVTIYTFEQEQPRGYAS